MALSSFLNVNGYDFPPPDQGVSYTIITTVNAGRNANNAAVGQRVGRDLFKFDKLEWSFLSPETWKMMLKAIEPFYVPVTIEDYRTGQPVTIIMYPGDRKATPLLADENSFLVTQYENCSFNLIDAGLE